jgi:RimJ/RimL family protein N-acetyltransferase
MTEFPQSITEYWDRVLEFGQTVQACRALTITIEPTLKHQRRVMLLRHADGPTRAAVTPRMASLLSLQAGAEPLLPEQLRTRLAEVGAKLHDPDLIFYCTDAAALGPADEGNAATRQLFERDATAFADFQSEASEQDKEGAFVELDHWAVFGAFEQQRLVGAASSYPWDDAAIADIGVLTLPCFRRKGHAKSLLRSISRHALSRGHQPQYRCQWDNEASIALATAAGFSLFGSWEVVSPEAPDV